MSRCKVEGDSNCCIRKMRACTHRMLAGARRRVKITFNECHRLLPGSGQGMHDHLSPRARVGKVRYLGDDGRTECVNIIDRMNGQGAACGVLPPLGVRVRRHQSFSVLGR